MYHNKTFLAVIPARSGSKGVKDKNIKNLGNKPLMAYTIEACHRAQIFDEIVVSTDDEKYAKVAKDYGASVPFLRPKELASDEAATNDVMLHVLNEMRVQGKNFDYVILLQPTSPLRNESHILDSVNILTKQRADSVISICKAEYPSYLTVKLMQNGELKTKFLDKKQIRRQDEVQEYRINGAIYLTSTHFFLENKSFYGGKVFPLIMEEKDSIDIDEEYQFQLAEFYLKNKLL